MKKLEDHAHVEPRRIEDGVHSARLLLEVAGNVTSKFCKEVPRALMPSPGVVNNDIQIREIGLPAEFRMGS